MNKITPDLWFDKEAKEAGAFYISVFGDARIKDTVTLHDTPSGPVDVVMLELAGSNSHGFRPGRCSHSHL